MRLAATELEGQHDFASFQSKGGRQTTVRTVHALRIEPVFQAADKQDMMALKFR